MLKSAACPQIDQQIGRRLWEWNKDDFPNVTKRLPIRFTHIERSIALSELGNFLSSLDGRIPLGEDDHKAFRKRSGFLPENNPDEPYKPIANSAGNDPNGANVNNPNGITPEQKAQAAKKLLEEALHITSRAGLHEFDK